MIRLTIESLKMIWERNFSKDGGAWNYQRLPKESWTIIYPSGLVAHFSDDSNQFLLRESLRIVLGQK